MARLLNLDNISCGGIGQNYIMLYNSIINPQFRMNLPLAVNVQIYPECNLELPRNISSFSQE